MPYGRGLTARGIRSLYVGALRAAEVDDGGGGTVWWRGCSVHAAPAHRLACHFSATMLPLCACGAGKVAPRAFGCGRSRNHLCGFQRPSGHIIRQSQPEPKKKVPSVQI